VNLLAKMDGVRVPEWSPDEIEGLANLEQSALIALQEQVVSLKKMGEVLKWMLADIWYWCNERDLDSQIFDGFTESEIANLSYLSLFPPVMRTLELSPSHYRVLGPTARRAVEAQNRSSELEADNLWEQIDTWLTLAVEKGWKANEFREQVKASTGLIEARTGTRPTAEMGDFVTTGAEATILVSPDKVTPGTWQADILHVAQQLIDKRPGQEEDISLDLEDMDGNRWAVLVYRVKE